MKRTVEHGGDRLQAEQMRDPEGLFGRMEGMNELSGAFVRSMEVDSLSSHYKGERQRLHEEVEQLQVFLNRFSSSKFCKLTLRSSTVSLISDNKLLQRTQTIRTLDNSQSQKESIWDHRRDSLPDTTSVRNTFVGALEERWNEEKRKGHVSERGLRWWIVSHPKEILIGSIFVFLGSSLICCIYSDSLSDCFSSRL